MRRRRSHQVLLVNASTVHLTLRRRRRRASSLSYMPLADKLHGAAVLRKNCFCSVVTVQLAAFPAFPHRSPVAAVHRCDTTRPTNTLSPLHSTSLSGLKRRRKHNAHGANATPTRRQRRDARPRRRAADVKPPPPRDERRQPDPRAPEAGLHGQPRGHADQGFVKDVQRLGGTLLPAVRDVVPVAIT